MKKFKKKCKHSKKYFYKQFIQDLKVSNPRQWYSKVKRITSYKIHENELPQCQEISSFDDQNQAELIADTYEQVANSYEPLKDGDVSLPEISEGTYPKITVKMVFNYLRKIKTNTATVHNDIPAKVIKKYAKYLCYPLCIILNTQIKRVNFQIPGKLSKLLLFLKYIQQ